MGWAAAILGEFGIEKFSDIEAKYLERKIAIEAADAAGPLATMSDAGKRGGRGNKAIDNVNSFTPNQGGNSAIYQLRRIARDAPDIYEAFKQGEFQSVRQAAIAAGVVRVPTPYEQVLKLLPKLSTGEREQLKSEL